MVQGYPVIREFRYYLLFLGKPTSVGHSALLICSNSPQPLLIKTLTVDYVRLTAPLGLGPREGRQTLNEVPVDPSITLSLHLPRKEVHESVSDSIIGITLRECWFLNKKKNSFGSLGL